MPWVTKGHKVPGSGAKQGQKYARTIDKELQRERIRQKVSDALEPLLQAQIEHALGVKYLVLRNPDGTYTRATNEEQLNAAIAAGAEQITIYTQAPSTAAFTDLMNRAFDKPAEQLRVTGDDGGPVEHVFRWAMPDRPPDASAVSAVTVRELPSKPEDDGSDNGR